MTCGRLVSLATAREDATEQFRRRSRRLQASSPAMGIRSADSHLADQKEFTEPVALSSPRHIDLPLARSAFVTGFDLVALRARCTANLRRQGRQVKQVTEEKSAICTVSFGRPGTVLETGRPTTIRRDARRTDVRARRRAPGRCGAAHPRRSGGS